jgi:hypothetical protein
MISWISLWKSLDPEIPGKFKNPRKSTGKPLNSTAAGAGDPSRIWIPTHARSLKGHFSVPLR